MSAAAGYGVLLLYTAQAYGWRGWRPGPPRPARPDASPRDRARAARDWLAQAGLGDVRPAEFVAVIGGLGLAGAVAGFVLFGAVVPALVLGGFVATFPVASYRHRRVVRLRRAQESWPRLIDEIRILTSSAGRSIPQALFEAGRSGPEDLRPAFAAAQREWLLTTDFARTLAVLKELLADATADAACETLLIAHELGGTDLDRRLADLAEDRRADARGRKDAAAHQAGARFARRFVLVVPIGMAVVGLSVGSGRAAYETPLGQLVVVIALGLVVACWAWAGQIMALPTEPRVWR